MTKTEELLAADLAVLAPCPFCNSRNARCCTSSTGYSWVKCQECASEGPVTGSSQQAAITAWNTRHDRLSAPRAYAEGVVVKVLEWSHRAPDLHDADSAFGVYRVADHGANWAEDRYEGYCKSLCWMSRHPTLDAAKAACQADYEARIRSALSVPEQAKEPGEGWRSMDSAPLDGKHCILAIQRGAFVYSAQGAYYRHLNGGGCWLSCISDEQVEPLAWMPNVLLPDHLTPWKQAAMIAASPSSASGKEAGGMVPISELAAARAETQRFKDERSYVVGFNDGWDNALEKEAEK